jgi:hypothetical protein
MAPSRHFAYKVSFYRFLISSVFLFLAGWPASAKGPGLSAIEVYPAENGPAYVEISNFVLNAKNEVHLCHPTEAISKNSYGKLQTIGLSAGMSLERAQNGVLWLTRPGGQPECVVPANLKDLERRETEMPAELAERTELQGEVVSNSMASTQRIPRMVPGVKIVLLDTLDRELAEYLLAGSAGKIPAWQSYIDKFPTGAHVGQAKASLAVLWVRLGNEALTKYQSTPKDAQSGYERLMAAKDALDNALALAPRNPPTEELAAGIHQEAQLLNQKALVETSLYRDALKKETAGYSHLLAAEAILAHTSRLDPNSTETISLNKEDTNARRKLDSRFVEFDNNLEQRHPEEAYESIKPLRAFATEYPDVQKRLDRLYSYYLEAGKKDESKNDPQDQVVEYRKALAIEPRPEMDEILKAAEQKAQESTDEAAIRTALNLSSGAEEDKDYVTAYEVLINLTPAQRKQQAVVDRLAALQDIYLQKAPAVARDLQRDNTPPKVLANEIALERAYDLMEHCFDLKSDPDLKDRILILGQSLSRYYLEQAQDYLNRQDGLSSNIGWAYLAKASRYKVLDEEALQNEIKSINTAHQAGSIPSISIKFEDASSTGSAGNFPIQLVRSTAASIASYSPKIKVVGPDERAATKPTFAMIGEARVIEAGNVETIQRTSTHSTSEFVVSDDWKTANYQYESANRAWLTAREALKAAELRGKKKQIEEERNRTGEAQKALDQAQKKLDATPKTRVDPTSASDTYNEHINHLSVTVQLRFQIQDSNGKTILTGTPISKTEETLINTIDRGMPGDMSVHPVTGGLSKSQFIEEVEGEARDALLQEVRRSVTNLPKTILTLADQRAGEGDTAGAAALYMLYLDSTQRQPSPDWNKAQKFLSDNYNFRDYGESPQA